VTTPASKQASPLSSHSAPVAATTDPVPAAGDDAFFQPIDVGSAFAEQIGRPSQPGFENQMGDAHRALEREMRNDGWAYAMEGELQNSMVNEVSTGEFRAEHVECRATMCEVRISGTARQTDAVKRWMDTLQKHEVARTLAMNYSSMSANDERVDMLMILRKPPSPPPRPH
jgi:hypothetical protein